MSEKSKQLYEAMFKRRLDPNEPFDGWKRVHSRAGEKEIERLLQRGYSVKTGYYTTSIRGFHDYQILWREKSPQVNP